ncbi:MAG: polysaccharide deacetylase family protein [Spirochaetaceae bacterium]|jgi:hypothetical protein|nr:polysaccharide deacetylase family protein [Spirochaetaceae bacterium]
MRKKLGYILITAILGSCATQGKIREKTPDPMEQAIKLAKETAQPKYFILDEAGNPLVKADLFEGFEAIYNLKGAEPDGSGGFAVPFSVRSAESVYYDWLYWTIPEDAAGLLLAFDDNYQEIWESKLDLFDRYKARVTFFVQGQVCDFCLQALRRGHDVGYHTLNHLNLPKVSREVFFEECFSAVAEFRQKDVPLTSFAYPFGLSEPWMHEELLQTFRLLRGYGVTFRVYDRETIQKGYISSKALDNILFKEDEAFESMIFLLLLTLKFIGGDRILPLTTHTIAGDADWGIKPHRLEYLLRTAADLQLHWYRYCDVQ